MRAINKNLIWLVYIELYLRYRGVAITFTLGGTTKQRYFKWSRLQTFNYRYCYIYLQIMIQVLGINTMTAYIYITTGLKNEHLDALLHSNTC